MADILPDSRQAKDLSSFREFMTELRAQVESGVGEYDFSRNPTLDGFLEAISAWLEDAAQAGLYDTSRVDWEFLATVLLMGWAYE